MPITMYRTIPGSIEITPVVILNCAYGVINHLDGTSESRSEKYPIKYYNLWERAKQALLLREELLLDKWKNEVALLPRGTHNPLIEEPLAFVDQRLEELRAMQNPYLPYHTPTTHQPQPLLASFGTPIASS